MHACNIQFYICFHLVLCSCSDYDDPHPQEHLIREDIANFTHSVDRSLRIACIKNTVLRIPF